MKLQKKIRNKLMFKVLIENDGMKNKNNLLNKKS